MSKKVSKIVVRIVVYLLLGALLGYIVSYYIQQVNMVVLWTFYGIMTVAAIISRWYYHGESRRTSKKKKFVQFADHVTYISATALFFMWVILYLFDS